jgi:hypothetical protein
MAMRLSRGQTAPTDAMIRESYPDCFDANEQILRAILDLIERVRPRTTRLSDADRFERFFDEIGTSSRAAASALEFAYDIIVEDHTDDATAAQRHGTFRVSPLGTIEIAQELRPVLRRLSEVISLVESAHEADRSIDAMQRSADRFLSKLRDIESAASKLRADDPKLPTLRERAAEIAERRRAKIDSQQRAKAKRQALLSDKNRVVEEDAVEKLVQDVANSISSRCGNYTAFSESLASKSRHRVLAQRAMRGVIAITAAVACVMGLAFILSSLRGATREEHRTVYFTTVAHMATALARQRTGSSAQQAATDAQVIVAGELLLARRRQNEKAVFGVSNALVGKCRMGDARACADVADRIDVGHVVATENLRSYALRLACERGLQASCVAHEKQIKEDTFRSYMQYFLEATNEDPPVEDMATLARAHVAYSLISCDLGWGVSCFEVGAYAVSTVSHLDLPGMNELGREYLRRGCDVDESTCCDVLEDLDG